MIKAIIFDLDGVLIDSEPFWQEMKTKVFSEAGVSITKHSSKETIGLRIDNVIEHWFSLYSWPEISKSEVEKRIVKGIVELIKKEGKPVCGAVELVKFFAGENLPMAIASSSHIEIIDAAVKKILIDKYIDVIHSAEHERFGKPHPDVYITAAEKLKIKPEHCLVFEDSLNGVLAAKAARMKCVAIPDRRLKKEKEKFYIADLIIESLEDFDFKCLDLL